MRVFPFLETATRYQLVRRGTQAASSQVATFTVEGAGTEWVDFALTFDDGQVPSARLVEVQTSGGAPVTGQSSSYCANPDGSARHLNVAAQVTGGQSYRLVTVAPSGTNRTVADLLAAIPGDIASVTLSGGLTGIVTVRDLLENATNRARLNNSSSYVITEQGPQKLGLVVARDFDTHLRITMNVRWYGGTTLWCGFLFEDGYLDRNSQNSRVYTATLVLNGVTKLTQAVTHWNRALWYRPYWSTGGTLYTRISADTLAGIPYYDPATAPTEAHLASIDQTVPPPMDSGDLASNLGGTGAHDWVAVMSRNDARLITSSMDPRAYRSMLRFHHGAMSFSYASAMDGVTGEMLSLSDRPTYSHQGGAAALGTGYFNGLSPQGNSSTGQPASHSFSAGFLPYLLTGEWAWMRLMQGWASYMTFWTDTNRNHTYNGVNVRKFYYGSQRGVAWSYRGCGQAGWLTPDWHYLKPYFNNTVDGNFTQDYVDYGPAFSLIGTTDGSEPITQYRSFMHFHMGSAVGYLVCELGYESGRPFAAHIAKYTAGLLGNTGEYNYCFATAQDHAIADVDAGPRYTTFTQMAANLNNVPAYAAGQTPGSQALADLMFANGDITQAVAGTLTGHAAEPDGYPANARPGVSYFTKLGVTNAAACWARLNGGQQPDYRNDPQSNIVPRP